MSGFNPAQPRGTNGAWAAGGGAGGGKQPAQAKPSRQAGGGKDLSQIAAKAGISEAQLLKLNPGLRGLVGTGTHVPKGTVIATTPGGEKAAAKSQSTGAVGKSVKQITKKFAAAHKAYHDSHEKPAPKAPAKAPAKGKTKPAAAKPGKAKPAVKPPAKAKPAAKPAAKTPAKAPAKKGK